MSKSIRWKTNLFHRLTSLHTDLMPILVDNPIYALRKTQPNLMSKCLSEEYYKKFFSMNSLLLHRDGQRNDDNNDLTLVPAYGIINIKAKSFFGFSSFMHFSKLPP